MTMPKKSEAAMRHNNEIRSEMYYWYKAHGICPYCGVRDPEPGRVSCLQCKRHQKILREKKDPGGAKRKAYNAERRARLKAAGICTDCGNARAVEGRIRCQRCEERMKESRKKWEILHAMDMEAEEARKRNGTHNL